MGGMGLWRLFCWIPQEDWVTLHWQLGIRGEGRASRVGRGRGEGGVGRGGGGRGRAGPMVGDLVIASLHRETGQLRLGTTQNKNKWELVE